MRKEDVGRSARLFDSATNVDRLLQNEQTVVLGSMGKRVVLGGMCLADIQDSSARGVEACWSPDVEPLIYAHNLQCTMSPME